MSVGSFLNFDDLIKIAGLLKANNYGEIPMTITTEVSEKMLYKINEDFYYRNKKDDDNIALPNHVDEVEVTIDNITFRYIKKEENLQSK